jgi:peptidoglycan/xylan/chitin deacetylase (PgdA/CDA1 family)
MDVDRSNSTSGLDATIMSPLAATKISIKNFILDSGAMRLASDRMPPSITILAYHSIQDRPEQFVNSIGSGIVHEKSVFESQMELIARKYNPVSLDEVLLFLRREKKLPKKSVVVTFDDGYCDNSEIAEPVLRRIGIPAVFYLTANLIGTSEAPWFCRLRHAFAITKKSEWLDPVRGQKRKMASPRMRNTAGLAAFEICSSMSGDVCRAAVQTIEKNLDVTPLALEKDLMMTWDQARRLHGQGHIIGSHTLTHPNLAHVSDEGIARSEIVDSKMRIEKELGAPVRHFSYPHPALNPQWTRETIRISREAGYQTAVTTTEGRVRAGDNPLLLPRLMVPGPADEFHWALENTFLGWS